MRSLKNHELLEDMGNALSAIRGGGLEAPLREQVEKFMAAALEILTELTDKD